VVPRHVGPRLSPLCSIAALHEQLKYEGPDNVAAIMVESITGTNGVIKPPNGYLEVCTETAIAAKPVS
jgi:taurine--2-oxoglutarate transaminase